MKYKFTDFFVSKEKQFSVGMEYFSKHYYVSFPQSTDNRLSEYEVYYKIPSNLTYLTQTDPLMLEPFVQECREGNHMNLKITLSC